jgi:ribose/xylose/arabinose/galactoside ABC-type transport system permease subunit
MQGAKHCPWCIYNGQGFRVAFVLILAAQAAVTFVPGRLDWKYRLALALAAFPLIGAVVAAIYGWISHYWS